MHSGFILGAEARYVAAFGIRDNDKIINRRPLQPEPPRREPRDISRLEMGFERHALRGAPRVYSVSYRYWIRGVFFHQAIVFDGVGFSRPLKKISMNWLDKRIID